MYRVVTLLLLCIFVAGATAQETDAPTGDVSSPEPAAEVSEAIADGAADDIAAADAEEVAADDEETVAEDADLDEQTYEEDEDDFIPTEEIPADEPIAFPSNI